MKLILKFWSSDRALDKYLLPVSETCTIMDAKLKFVEYMCPGTPLKDVTISDRNGVLPDSSTMEALRLDREPRSLFVQIEEASRKTIEEPKRVKVLVKREGTGTLSSVELIEGSSTTDLRTAVESKLAIEAALLKLSFKGEALPMGEPLRELQIYDGSVVNLRVPYRRPEKETVLAQPAQELIDFEF